MDPNDLPDYRPRFSIEVPDDDGSPSVIWPSIAYFPAGVAVE
jgi:hypothetical protein